MLKLNEVLKASKLGGGAPDYWTELFARRVAGGWTVSTITGTLPITFRSNGTALIDYRIYGTADGAGVQTENLLNIYDTWKGSFATVNVENDIVTIVGSWFSYLILSVEKYIDYYINFNVVSTTSVSGVAVYGVKNGEYDNNDIVMTMRAHPSSFNSGDREQIAILFYCAYASTGTTVYSNIMLTEDSTPPDHYIPPGYKLPLTNTGENLWQKSEAPDYDYSTDYKTYNADKAVPLPAGTYTLSSDGRLPLIQVFTPELIQVVPANSVVSYSDDTYTLGWNDYALMAPSASTTKVATITLSQDAVLTFAGVTNVGTYLLINKGDTVLRADYPLYIGDTKLLSGDYIDYESGKIVRNGIPQDPPLPFPELETFKGTNTLDSTETLGEVTIKGQIKPQS